VGAVLGEPLARLGAAQSLLGLDGELGKDLVDRQLLEVGRGVRASLMRARRIAGQRRTWTAPGNAFAGLRKRISKANEMRLNDRDQRPAYTGGVNVLGEDGCRLMDDLRRILVTRGMTQRLRCRSGRINSSVA